MKAQGYLVITVDDSPAVSTTVEINTGTLFMTCRYGSLVVQTAHPEQRAFMEKLLTEIASLGDTSVDRLPALDTGA